MLNAQPRCLYRNNQLGEVICQLRFPEILSIGTNLPDKFQEAIRADFPQYSQRMEKVPGATGPQAQGSINYQFTTADGIWRVNLTTKFISLATYRYTCWEDFAQKLDKPLAAFIKIYQPAYFDRVGLRYMNFFSRKSLELEGVPFRELIDSKYLGLLGDEEVSESSCARSTVDAELALRGGVRVKLHAGPGQVRRGNQVDNEIKFIFDQDLFMPGKLAVNLSTAALNSLHSQAYSLFRDVILHKLHQAMEPEAL